MQNMKTIYNIIVNLMNSDFAINLKLTYSYFKLYNFS